MWEPITKHFFKEHEMKFQITPENEQTKKEYKMERIIMPEGNFDIGLRITPYFFAENYSVVGICIIYKTWGFAWVNEEWVQIMIDPMMSEGAFNPQVYDQVKELHRAQEAATKIYRDAAAGRITEEFFNNQEVDAEKF